MPTFVAGECADLLFDHFEKLAHLGRIALEVLGRKQPERDDGDLQFRAPAQQFIDLVRALAVSFGFVRVAHRARPSPVPVLDHADMFWNGAVPHDRFQPLLVGAVEEITWGERHSGEEYTRPNSRRRTRSAAPGRTRGVNG